MPKTRFWRTGTSEQILGSWISEILSIILVADAGKGKNELIVSEAVTSGKYSPIKKPVKTATPKAKKISLDEAIKIIFEEDGPLLERLAR
jgi:hypothetical protein